MSSSSQQTRLVSSSYCLRIEAAGAAVDLPVDVLDVVAGDVLAVLGELDGEAVVGALVHAREVALDDQPGLQLQAAHLGQRQRDRDIVAGRPWWFRVETVGSLHDESRLP